MQITIYTGFSKRRNSTKQPAGGSTINCHLKENTSIMSPVFELEGNNFSITYVKWDDRYYFVDDITSIRNNAIALSCSIDALATFKTAIGSYNCFIERASSQRDQYIIDNAISIEQRVIHADIVTSQLNNFSSTGCYIIRVVGKDASSGGISNYAITQSQLQDVLSYVFDDTNFPTEISDDFIKTFFNPFQYIVSLMWFPIDIDSVYGSPSSIQLGWWTVAGSFKKLSGTGYTDIHQLTAPNNYYSDFRAYDPRYSQYVLHIPGTGAINLDPSLFSIGDIWCETTVDYLTGEANTSIALWAGGVRKGTVATVSGRWGVPITVGQVAGVTGGIVSTIGSIVSAVGSGSVAGAVGGISGAVNGIENILSPTPSVMGNTGNRQQLVTKSAYSLSVRNFGSGDIPNAVYGRPLCKNMTIGSLTGFIKCSGASIEVAGDTVERELIDNYLNTGFYYE